jgi:hypothetical protein
MTQEPHPPTPEDNSPEMRFNNLCLSLRNLEKGPAVKPDTKRALHAELVSFANKEFTGEKQRTALNAAHKYLEQSLTDPAELDKKYQV